MGGHGRKMTGPAMTQIKVQGLALGSLLRSSKGYSFNECNPLTHREHGSSQGEGLALKSLLRSPSRRAPRCTCSPTIPTTMHRGLKGATTKMTDLISAVFGRPTPTCKCLTCLYLTMLPAVLNRKQSETPFGKGVHCTVLPIPSTLGQYASV